MTTQLRTYTIAPGRLDEWVGRWRAEVVPLRRRYGFRIPASWVDRVAGQHLWVVEYPGPGSFEEANARYWASPERTAMRLDPADFLVAEQIRVVDPVQLPG